MEINIPYAPHPGQQLVLDSTAKYKVLCCGRRWGKSLISQLISLEAIFSGQRVGYVTPTNSLGKEFYNEMLKLLKDIPQNYLKVNGTDLRIEIKGLGKIEFYSGEPEALEKSMRGRKFHKVIIDEAAKIQDLENAWINIISPTLIDYDGEALIVSTPRGKNFFYQLYLKGLEKIDEFESWNFPTDTNPHLPKKAVERLKESMPVSSYRQEMLAIPTENDDNPFPADNIARNTVRELSKEPTVVFGIDLGRKHDPTVIIGVDKGGSMTYYKSFQLSWPETIQTIKDLPSAVLKIMDATGLGDVVYGQLELEVKHLRAFVFTNQSKARIVQQLIKDVEMDQVKFTKEVADEMYTFEQIESTNGNMKYEAQPGYHDDRIMSFAMANHYKKYGAGDNNFRLYSI